MDKGILNEKPAGSPMFSWTEHSVDALAMRMQLFSETFVTCLEHNKSIMVASTAATAAVQAFDTMFKKDLE